MEFLNKETLTKTEQDILVNMFLDPTMKKYLRILSCNAVEDLASLSVISENDSELAKKHALVQGKLSVLSTLSNISK